MRDKSRLEYRVYNQEDELIGKVLKDNDGMYQFIVNDKESICKGLLVPNLRSVRIGIELVYGIKKVRIEEYYG